jgi:hypothetical protein
MMRAAVRQDIAFGVYPSARVSFVLSRHALDPILNKSIASRVANPPRPVWPL